MKCLLNKLVKGAVVAAIIICARSAQAETLLPPPVMPFAASYHDFYSYSTNLLLEMKNVPYFSPYVQGITKSDFGFGSGTVDPLIFANGGVNHNAPLPAPINLPNGQQATAYTAVWPGTSGGQNKNDPVIQEYVTVKALLDSIHSVTGAGSSNIPVFMFDMSESGSASSLAIRGSVDVFTKSGATESIVKSWFFDNPGGAYVPVPGSITVPADPGKYNEITVDTNIGNGFADFVVYAPTMDLTAYNDMDHYFRVNFSLAGLSGAGEELGLSGAFGTLVPPPSVPEPGTVALLGLGIAGLGLYSHRRKQR